jgi:hypothetical protein
LCQKNLAFCEENFTASYDKLTKSDRYLSLNQDTLTSTSPTYTPAAAGLSLTDPQDSPEETNVTLRKAGLSAAAYGVASGEQWFSSCSQFDGRC